MATGAAGVTAAGCSGAAWAGRRPRLRGRSVRAHGASGDRTGGERRRGPPGLRRRHSRGPGGLPGRGRLRRQRRARRVLRRWGLRRGRRLRRAGLGLGGHGWLGAGRAARREAAAARCPARACPRAAAAPGRGLRGRCRLRGRDGLAWGRSRRRSRRLRSAGDRAHGLHRLRLRPRGRRGHDALLLFGRPLGGAAGPLAQALDLARLREDEQREDRDAHDRGECGDRAYLGERVGERERERRHELGECTRGSGASRPSDRSPGSCGPASSASSGSSSASASPAEPAAARWRAGPSAMRPPGRAGAPAG